MMTLAEAERRVAACAAPRTPIRIPLHAAAGLALREPVAADRDSPPFDKALVDGYAVRACEVSHSGCVLRVADELVAGQVPTRPLTTGTAIRIMTGTPIPEGADAVVMVERTVRLDASPADASPPAGVPDSAADRSPQVRLDEVPRAGQNIMRRGESMRAGDVVLQPGHLLRGIELGLLAELGRTHVLAVPRPTVAILSTGNELVPVDQQPAPGQIRNSNGPMLEGLTREAGGEPAVLGIARDEPEALQAAMRVGLASDVLLLSGGVSAGVLDLVPAVLRELGVREVFHKVDLKPGKPVWFGKHPGTDQTRLVFGLPGNPVSSLVCFHLLVRPALRQMAGLPRVALPRVAAEMGVAFRHRSDRPTFYPARVLCRDERWILEPLGWRGSADLRTLVDANALLCLPSGEQELAAGSPVTFLWLGHAP